MEHLERFFETVSNDLHVLNYLNIHGHFSRTKASPRCSIEIVLEPWRSRWTAGGDIELYGVGGAEDHLRFGSRSPGAWRAGGMGDFGGKFFLSARCGALRH